MISEGQIGALPEGSWRRPRVSGSVVPRITIANVSRQLAEHAPRGGRLLYTTGGATRVIFSATISPAAFRR
jgi:hypothetical protein